jgi:hypothetical protein
MDLSNSKAVSESAVFDYREMDEATAGEAKAAVGRYRARLKAYVIDTGRDLLAVKKRTEHGVFLKWVEAEMGMNPRTAQRAMSTAEVLGAKSDTVSYLPPTSLYSLAASSTPSLVRDEIVRRLEAGEALTPKAIDSRLWEARAEAKRAKADAKLTPEERKRQAQAKRASETRRKRELEKWQADQDEAVSKRKAASNELASLLALLLDEAAYQRAYELFPNINVHDMPAALASARRAAAQ